MDGAVLARHAGLDAVLCLQDGIIRRNQAMTAGLAESRISSRVRRRTWVRVFPGVYVVDVDPATPTARVRATALWAGDDAVITAAAAAWWWELTDRPPRSLDVLVPPRQRMSRFDGIRVIRADLDEREVDRHRRLRLTTPAATCLYLARAGEPDLLDVALRTVVGQAQLDEALELGRGRPGQRRARHNRERSATIRGRHPNAGYTGSSAPPASPVGRPIHRCGWEMSCAIRTCCSKRSC